jgi:hypothetical protein
MKGHFLLVGLFAGTLSIGNAVKATQVTTPFVAFSNVNTNTQGKSPATLTFQTFNQVYSGGGVLKSVGYKLASSSDGSGSASATQKLTFQGALGDSGSFGRVSRISYQMNLAFNNSLAINGNVGSTTSATPAVPGDTAFGTNTIYTLNGSYGGNSVFTGNLTSNQLAMFSTGASVSTANYQVLWGANSDFVVSCYGPTSPDYDPSCTDPGGYSWGSAGVINNGWNRALLGGYIALVYDYEEPRALVPAPLPLLGAGAAFAWTRRIRKRIAIAS